MVKSAKEQLLGAGIDETKIVQFDVPGSFEIPLIGRQLAEKKSVDALIGIGIIVEGETHHARLIAEQAARGVMDVQLRYGIPFAFEILYVDDLTLARDRTEKGGDAARSVLELLASLQSL